MELMEVDISCCALCNIYGAFLKEDVEEIQTLLGDTEINPNTHFEKGNTLLRISVNLAK